MKALLSALLTARQAAPELPRDERSSIRGTDGRDKPIDYPSDSEVQRAAAGFGRVGLLLLPEGIEPTTDGKALLCSWTLIHLESGESKPYCFSWPLAPDMAQQPDMAQAGAWTKARRHLVMHLLDLRVAPRVFTGDSAAPAPAAPDDLPPELGGRGIPTPRRDAPVELLHVLVDQWARIEAEHDAALGHPVKSRTMADAWARCRMLKEPRMPTSAAEFAELAGWLRGAMR